MLSETQRHGIREQFLFNIDSYKAAIARYENGSKESQRQFSEIFYHLVDASFEDYLAARLYEVKECCYGIEGYDWDDVRDEEYNAFFLSLLQEQPIPDSYIEAYLLYEATWD